MPKPFFREFFPSRFDAMGGVLDRAVAALAVKGWITPKDEPCTRLCLEEALVNAIRHGNRCNESAQAGLEMSEDGDECIMRIYDEGCGFSPDQVHLPDAGQLGGRGVCLMRHFMRSVAYDAAAKCLVLSFHRKAAEAAEALPR